MSEPAPTHVLVVDDDPEIRMLLRRCFELEGYIVGEAKSGTEMRSYLAGNAVSLVTLDLGLGGEDGLALAREIRSTQAVPIIMVTGKHDPIDRVVGLELGADDYITKPFHLREVLARVRAVLRRSAMPPAAKAPDATAPAQAGCYLFDGWKLDPNRRELTDQNSTTVSLTTAEFNLLLIFVERPTRVLTRDSIMDLLKGHDSSPFDRSIDTLIGRMRKKIELDIDNPRLIKTVRGVGYVFSAEVRRG